jgi:hypothetical protein
MFYCLLLKQEAAAAAHSYCHILFLSHSWRMPLLQITKLRINYIIIDHNAVINNYYGRRKYLILLFKIPMGSQKDFFFEIYRQFGHAPSYSFASPSLEGAELTRRPIDARSSVANERNNSALMRTRSL